jgi:hypothetical protein
MRHRAAKILQFLSTKYDYIYLKRHSSINSKTLPVYNARTPCEGVLLIPEPASHKVKSL